MKLPLARLAVAATVVVAAEAGGANVRRRLSFEKVAGYPPSSQVTDHCAIDRDQAAMEAQLAIKTPESFAYARRIYNEGGNSESYARVALGQPGGLAKGLGEGVIVMGQSAGGERIMGSAYEDYERGEKIIKVQYQTSDVQANYVRCQVGGLVETNTEGCFAAEGNLTIDGTPYPYKYDPALDNRNGRTIAGFSEGIKDRDIIHTKEDFRYFFEYYGTDDYAHSLIEAAFVGRSTRFPKNGRGNADFSRYGFVGKEQFIKRATECLSVFMFIVRQWEEAMDDCERDCVGCNAGSTHSWDEGVCYYTGSLEGEDGRSDDGKMLHQLADDMCREYTTCGVDGTERTGTAKLNYDLFGRLSLGNFQILTGNCPAARETTREIVGRMYVPLVQGALLRAHGVDRWKRGEKEKAEGAAFAAAVLPRVHAASPEAAHVIYQNLKVGAPSTDVEAVKEAFESVYADIGISCVDVGGLWNDATGEYYAGMEPCRDNVKKRGKDNFLAIILGSTFGGLFVITTLIVIYMRRREKAGKPVFNPLTRTLTPNEMSADILSLFQRKETYPTVADGHRSSAGSTAVTRSSAGSTAGTRSSAGSIAGRTVP